MNVSQHMPVAQIELDELPVEVVNELPSGVVDQIKEGLLDMIPADVVAELPASLQDKIPEGLLVVAASNSTVTNVLLVLGVIAVIGFIFGVIKSAVKWMLYSAIIGVAAWYFFFQS